MPNADPWSRRDTLTLMGGTLVTTLAGCCTRGFPRPEIPAASAKSADTRRPARFLAPARINVEGAAPAGCIDVHAHFFNASDVTIRGYLEGPVAYAKGGVLGELIKLLAPLAEILGDIAPTARAEYDSLVALSARDMNDADRRKVLFTERDAERQTISREFFRLLASRKGRAFRAKYEEIMKPGPRAQAELRPRIRTLDETSIVRAMTLSEALLDGGQLKAFAQTDESPYAEGVLAFIGYMLSSRKSNLLTYQGAFTESTGTIGVQRTLFLLVDYDRWLKCPPRSAHEDQMKVAVRLAELSGGYLTPVVGYNPWTDLAENGAGLARVEAAAAQGFVAAKIYPQNGFRPWRNTGLPEPHGVPSGADLDRVLKTFWLRCRDLSLPVIAHAGESMGSDATHDDLGSPTAWESLVKADFWPDNEGPRVSLGHFGGDDDKNDWTREFVTKVMSAPRGRYVFADLGYWENLQCATAGTLNCQTAKARLKAVLSMPLTGGQVVADRVLYGSDWLMLSQEKNWPAYAGALLAALQDIAPEYLSKIFAVNAKVCFPALGHG